jgi:GTPase SAR1 family protein
MWKNKYLKILVVGDSGLGKTTLIQTLLSKPGENLQVGWGGGGGRESLGVLWTAITASIAAFLQQVHVVCALTPYYQAQVFLFVAAMFSITDFANISTWINQAASVRHSNSH